PLNLVGVDIRGRVFDRGRKVENDLVVGRRPPDVGDRLADLEREIEFGAGEALGRILEPQVRPGGDERARQPFHQAHRVGRDLGDGRLLGAEDITALGGRSGVVEMEDDVARPLNRLDGAGDQVFAALAQHLDGNVRRDPVFLDQAAYEIELDLRSRGEADLNLLEADLDEEGEEFELFLHIHRDGEGLVAIAEVDAAPDRRGREGAV